MIAIIDYGAGNLGSVYKAFRHIGASVTITDQESAVDEADALVLPGVGAFGHCMSGLSGVGLTDATKRFIRSGRPFLGICVGFQMLFEESDEMGASPGLGILQGKVVRFDLDDRRSTIDDRSHGDRPSSIVHRLKVPHIGWNELRFREDAPLFVGLNQADRVYFVHSYYPEPEDKSVITAVTEYGYTICAAIQKDNVHATQFHPEKSGAVGLQILRNFAYLAA